MYGTTEYPNTFKRQSNFPLDKTSRFETMFEAESYASTNPTAYGGQIISVKTSEDKYKVYVLQKSTENGINYKLEEIQGEANVDITDEYVIFDGGNSRDVYLGGN